MGAFIIIAFMALCTGIVCLYLPPRQIEEGRSISSGLSHTQRK